MNINIQIMKRSYDKINLIKKWYNSYFNTNITQKNLLDYVLKEFIKSKELDYLLEPENYYRKISSNNFFLGKKRFDNNLNPTVGEYIDAIKEYLQKDNNNDVIESLALEFIKTNPQVEEILKVNRLIKQNIEVEEMMDKTRKVSVPTK